MTEARVIDDLKALIATQNTLLMQMEKRQH
jgi:hypothetical protein